MLLWCFYGRCCFVDICVRVLAQGESAVRGWEGLGVDLLWTHGRICFSLIVILYLLLKTIVMLKLSKLNVNWVRVRRRACSARQIKARQCCHIDFIVISHAYIFVMSIQFICAIALSTNRTILNKFSYISITSSI